MRSAWTALTLIALTATAGADVRPELRASVPDESRRLVLHFDEVLAELEARDTRELSAARRAARRAAIDRLRRYRDRGLFPQNRDFAAHTPYFIDHRGTRCAMAYLIERSGESALVDRVARTANNALVRELAGDPALIRWLDANGLSVDEAARIQPAYDPPPCDDECRDDEQCVATETGNSCSKICDPGNDSCGADSQCVEMLPGPACFPPVLAEGERPDSGLCAASGRGGAGAALLIALALIVARRRRAVCASQFLSRTRLRRGRDRKRLTPKNARPETFDF